VNTVHKFGLTHTTKLRQTSYIEVQAFHRLHPKLIIIIIIITIILHLGVLHTEAHCDSIGTSLMAGFKDSQSSTNRTYQGQEVEDALDRGYRTR